MELYFKDLISEEKLLDKLVDDLSLVVQGENLSETLRAKMDKLLGRLKIRYEILKTQASASVQRTDRILRRNPYAFIGAGIALGLVLGLALKRKK